MLSFNLYLLFVSKIGLILSIISLLTLAEFHPASVHPNVSYSCSRSLIGLGESNEIKTRYLGLFIGNAAMNVILIGGL